MFLWLSFLVRVFGWGGEGIFNCIFKIKYLAPGCSLYYLNDKLSGDCEWERVRFTVVVMNGSGMVSLIPELFNLKFSFSSSYPDMSCFFFEKVIGICAVLLPGLMFFKQNEIMASFKGFLF